MDGKRSIGRKQYEDYLNGKSLTYKGSVLAKCYECSNGYLDGREDCCITRCPLYQFMPYRKTDV